MRRDCLPSHPKVEETGALTGWVFRTHSQTLGQASLFLPVLSSVQTPEATESENRPRETRLKSIVLTNIWRSQDFLGGPVVKTPAFQCKGYGFDP